MIKFGLARPLYWMTTVVPCAVQTGLLGAAGRLPAESPTFGPDDARITYMGRVDHTNPKLPRFWAPGVTVSLNFRGPDCTVLLNDQVLWGTSHNYMEIVLDGVPRRIRLKEATNEVRVATGLAPGRHSLQICKDTESGIGYVEFAGVRCAALERPDRLPRRKIEFIGDSITAGAGADQSDEACGKGVWYAQHNNYMSYGPKTARLLNAQWEISGVSGIGMIHSCCDMNFTMPEVYDQIANRPKSDPYAQGAAWDFRKDQPEIITVCLGQNDGPENPEKFVAAYQAFVTRLRTLHPKSQIVLLTSPMGDARLNEVMKKNLMAVRQDALRRGDQRVQTFFFSRSWNDGCGGHPSIDNDTEVATELAGYLRTLK